MRFDKLHLKNFRGFEILDIEEFHPSFNLIIGDNGSGKTAILEALTVAMGSFFLGITNVNSRHILYRDIRIATFEYNQEHAVPVIVKAYGEVLNNQINWTRELKGEKNRTILINQDIKNIAKDINYKVKNDHLVKLPVLAYYATGRLFDEVNDKKIKEKKKTISSRFRAYERCLEAKSTFRKFEGWFKGKELAKIQKKSDDLGLRLVRKMLIENIPNCEHIFYEFDPDKDRGINVQLNDGRTLPFNYLSDGTRNFFAIMADIAYKCVTLNRHLKEDALKTTDGIVLIDELDLHLHPEWQRKIVLALRDTFPSIQFIVSTHSPFIIQATADNQLINLKNGVIEKGRGNNLSIEDIAEDIQLVKNPQWSLKRQKMFKIAKEYYKAVKLGTDTQEMKDSLDKAMKPFAIDTAFYAIVEQEKIVSEYNKVKNETD